MIAFLEAIRQLTSHFAERLSLEALPLWALMLNPVEPLWGWLKYDQLCNFAPQDALELEGRVIAELEKVRDDQVFLRNSYHASELPLSRTLLFKTCYKVTALIVERSSVHEQRKFPPKEAILSVCSWF